MIGQKPVSIWEGSWEVSIYCIPVKVSADKHHPLPTANMLNYGKQISEYRLIGFNRHVSYLRFCFLLQEIYVVLPLKLFYTYKVVYILSVQNTELCSAAW